METLPSPVLWEHTRRQLTHLEETEDITKKVQQQALKDIEDAEVVWKSKWCDVQQFLPKLFLLAYAGGVVVVFAPVFLQLVFG